MEVIVKIKKTNKMTNAWGKTKRKTDKDKRGEGGPLPFALSITDPFFGVK